MCKVGTLAFQETLLGPVVDCVGSQPKTFMDGMRWHLLPLVPFGRRKELDEGL